MEAIKKQTCSAIDLSLRRNEEMALKLSKSIFITRGPKQRDPCWELKDKIAMLDTAVRQWKCAPIYIIQDTEEDKDEVFDGAHRCEAIFEFIDGKYSIEKVPSVDWESSPLKDCIGLKYNEVPKPIQKLLKEYEFDINIIDSETANNPNSLKMLWSRLSMAGKPLNNFESQIPVYHYLHNKILEPNLKQWYNTPFFPAKSSKRGQLEVKLKKILALSHYEQIPSCASMEALIKKWSEDLLGKTIEQIEKNSIEQSNFINAKLQHLRSLLTELEDRNILRDKDANIIVDKSREVPFNIILGRLGYWFPTISKFRRYDTEICKVISDILKKNPNDLCKSLEVNSRNATFQKKLILYLDDNFKSISQKNDEKRLFSQSEKIEKLKEQNNLCTLCNEQIFEHQRSAGDHIIEFCRGGKTSYDNLQIVHKLCHEQKNMK
jgi:hypothetical protein